ncbi:MAG: DUF7714 family protein [Candidatus Jordarchaeum sp.]|uniref:DUF7714 family protein n=1 Tax=Candidatus Jordarchaeum sp. TaxID=2823881 RepID=UPI00404988F6
MPRVVHPQQVNIVKVKEPQDAKTLKGKKVFHTTKYILAQSPTGFTVYEIKTLGNNLIKTITSAILLSTEQETQIAELPKIDPTQKTEVIKAAIKHLKKDTKAIVFKSKFEHIGIALFESPNTIIGIIDITPPKPAKLEDQVQYAKKQQYVRKDTIFKIKIIDILNETTQTKPPIIFPCSATTEREFLFLDTDADKITPLKDPVLVVGCPITFETVKELNPKIKMKKIDICPAHIARKETTSNDFQIVRCCRASTQGTQIYSPKTNLIIALQWEPTIEEFLEAIYLGTLIKKHPKYPQF